MTDCIFIDTNVLVHARDTTEIDKHDLAREWMGFLWRERCGRLSFQVLQEFYITVTRKLTPGLETSLARADVRALLAWQPVGPDATLFDAAWRMQDRYGLSWWDALVVSAAHVTGAHRLLTEDLQDGQDFEGVEIVNPFAHAPTD